MGCCLLAWRHILRSTAKLLVYLLVLSHLCMGAVSAPTGFGPHVEMAGLDDKGPYFERRYKLINRCSERHVQLVGNKVRANGDPKDGHTTLYVTTRGFNSQLTIQNKARKYLCFNSKGKLILRDAGLNEERCLFRELQVQQYTEYESVSNSEWKIGFKKKHGKPLLGSAYLKHNKLRRCYEFLKRDDTGAVDRGGSSDGGPLGDVGRIPHRGAPRSLVVDPSTHSELTTVVSEPRHKLRHRDGEKPRRRNKNKLRKRQRDRKRRKG